MSHGLHRTDFVELNPRKCQACWRCVDVCARQVIGKVAILWHRHARLRAAKTCTGCLACAAVCPPKAIVARGNHP